MGEDNGNGKLYAHQLVDQLDQKIGERLDRKFKQIMERVDAEYVSQKECRDYHEDMNKQKLEDDKETAGQVAENKGEIKRISGLVAIGVFLGGSIFLAGGKYLLGI